MKKIKVFLILFTFISFSTQSQIKKQLEFGLAYGYKLNKFNFFIGYKLVPNKLVLNLDLSDDKYQNTGVGLHLNYFPLKKNTINPYFGLGVSRNTGKSYSFDRITDKVTNFNISDANYITPFVGIKYNDVMVDEVRTSRMSIFFQIGYKNSFNSNPNVYYVSGPEDIAKLNDIQSYIKNGIVGSFGIIVSWGK